MANNRKLSFVPSFGTPFKPNNLNKALTKLNQRPAPLLRPSTTSFNPEPIVMEANSRQGTDKKQRTSRKAKARTSEYVPPIFVDAGNFSSGFSSSDDFRADLQDNRQGLFPERRSAPLTFDYKDKNPLSVMQLEDNYSPLQFPAGDTVSVTPKLAVNLGNYHRNFEVDNTAWRKHLEIIFNRYSRDIIATIRSKIVDSWTLPNFLSYMSDIVELMETYYCVDSVLAYEGSIDKKDRNPVLIQMKTEFSNFDILVKHDEARRIIKNCWLPDKFSALIAWTYQNYKTGIADQCSNYRMFSHDRFLKNPRTENFDAAGLLAYYTLKIGNVTTVNNRNIISLLCQTYPEGKIGNLPLSCSESVYDHNHYEFSVNQGISWPATDTGFATYAGFPNNDDYNLYSSEMSAEEAGCFPFVLNSTYDDTIAEFTNGCFIPKMRTVKQDGSFIAQSDWEYATNKFYCFNSTKGSDNFEFYSRNIVDYSTLSPMQDTHIMRTDNSASVPSVGVAGCNSMSKGHFQNLYFNTDDARLLVMKEFLNSMFYLK